ncbi:MAG: hypothetical protein AB8G18_01690 [Gammaproteobacteria bacterium]
MEQSNSIDSSSFVGNWIGIRPEGVTTFHSDSSFKANGEIEVRFFSCLSSHTESRWTDRGEWTWADNILTITLTTDTDTEGVTETYVNEYTLLEEDFDRRIFRNENDERTFWLQRRWRDEPYSCATTKADVDADRSAAQSDGRFQSVYPDYTGNDS